MFNININSHQSDEFLIISKRLRLNMKIHEKFVFNFDDSCLISTSTPQNYK